MHAAVPAGVHQVVQVVLTDPGDYDGAGQGGVAVGAGAGRQFHYSPDFIIGSIFRCPDKVQVLKPGKILEFTGLQDLDLVWAAEGRADDEIGELMELPAGTGADSDSALPRAVVVAGISENDLHNLMSTCRAGGMKQALWAVVTPASEKWPLRQLVAELEAERQALEAGQ